jgi:type I restriction enzyme S subunit
MAGEWATLPLDALKAEGSGSIAIGPFGSRMKADKYTAVGIPVIRGTNLSDTRSFTGEFVYVSPETADELLNCNVRAGDLVFPHRGAIGEVGIVPADGDERYILSTSLMKFTCNRTLVDPFFLFYFFRSPAGRHELLKNASTVGTVDTGAVKEASKA